MSLSFASHKVSGPIFQFSTKYMVRGCNGFAGCFTVVMCGYLVIGYLVIVLGILLGILP